ncbi:trypsin-like serine proteases, typically periplasmic [Candidatus Scalindua japonica]|uniref:Trypsin-like serine proteases, typically periplasmic n=1 Tax=Candidatus Scalindua japonica TaxID=1284222 RepID=A0A286TWT7_9BACT|nr:trypsin-like peptidase domain-containing protein [Candidatus Scalindua japonica]GAX60334.1 trypsin-like serine proteases, typically periplasmic [Candidatus Scalindua japonica]
MKLTLTDIRSLFSGSLSCFVVIGVLLLTNSFSRESLAEKTLSDTFVSIVKDTKKSVVTIHTTKISEDNTLNRGFRIKGQGTGVIYDKKGFIITNKHVVKNAGEIIIRLHDESEYKAEIVGTDERSDIVVLRIDAENLTPAGFGNSDSLELGEIVLSIGNSFGLGQTVTSGIISAEGTSNLQLTGFEDFIQTDATINPNSYGGPLVNLNGEVVGINTLPPKQTVGYFGISLAIPINVVKKVTEDLIQYGKITRGWLGVTAQPVTRELQKALGLKKNLGALVSDIEPGSAAANAGIKSGDVIIKYDGKKLKNILHLRSLVKGTEINKEVRMTVIRDGVELEFTTTMLESSKTETENKKDLFSNLGVNVQNLTSKLSITLGYEGEEGIVITNVQRGSPAFKAGLTKGDLIVEVQHKPVTSSEELYQAILKIRNEEDILLFIKRPDKASKFIVLKQKKGV